MATNPNLASNVNTKVSTVIAKEFMSSQVVTKTVDTTSVAGANGIQNDTGDTVYLKRPSQYTAIETPDGDISSEAKNEIGVGRIAATVQNMITIPINYANIDEVTSLNQLQEILAPASRALAARAETNLGRFMLTHSALTYGTPGTAVNAWNDVSGAMATMQSLGVPMEGDNFYNMNPFANSALSQAQTGLTAADGLVRTAWENSEISPNFAGMRVMSSNALTNYTAGATAGETGALGATPDPTWLTHKDTQEQTLVLGGLTVSTVDAVRAGDVIEFDGVGALARSYVNQTNDEVATDQSGELKWRCTVVTGGDTDIAGDVSVTVTNAAIYGSAGGLDEQYTNISNPLTSGDVFTILGVANALYKPNLFYNKSAFVYATLDIPKLHATDMIATTEEGLSMRITKYSEGDKNQQKWRIDMLPVIGVANPLFAGKGYGVPSP